MKLLFIIIYLSFMVMAYHLMYTDIISTLEIIDCATDMECMELNPNMGDY